MTVSDRSALAQSPFVALAEANDWLVEYDGTEFDPPIDVAWFRVQVREESTTQVSLGAPGANIFRTTGFVFVTVFGPFGGGSGASEDLAGTIADAYRAANVDGFRFTSSSVVNVGRHRSWYSVIVRVRFEHDELA